MADGRQGVSSSEEIATASYARVLVVWVVVLAALYAFQELFR